MRKVIWLALERRLLGLPVSWSSGVEHLTVTYEWPTARFSKLIGQPVKSFMTAPCHPRLPLDEAIQQLLQLQNGSRKCSLVQLSELLKKQEFTVEQHMDMLAEHNGATAEIRARTLLTTKEWCI
jgi:hypothetical protein